MKKIALLTSLALAALFTAPAHSVTVSNPFNVAINLTSVCKLSAITDVAFSYTAFQAGAQASTGGGFTLQCTSGVTHSMGIVLGTGAGPGATSVTTTDSAVNLAYTLTTPTVVAANGTALTYSIGGSMAAAQAGTCATGSCTNGAATNKSYTLYITY